MSDSDWVTIALLGKPRGNRGELTAVSFSSHPERFSSLREVHLFGDGSPYQIESVWHHQGVLIFQFAGVGSISEAERLYGYEVRIPASERAPLEENEYYETDLIGCEVRKRESGELIGRVSALQDGSGSGVLEIDGKILIPFARAICTSIDPVAKQILVDLPDGLLDVN